jgi:uncharacterized protein
MTSETLSDSQIRRILSGCPSIAVVGLSDKPHRDSFRVASYLQAHGYRIIPANPGIREALGEMAYPTLQEVPCAIDVVDIFRRVEAVPEIVDEAISVGAKVIWMQSGIVHDQAAEKAYAAGLQVVMNRCIMVEHRRLLGE